MTAHRDYGHSNWNSRMHGQDSKGFTACVRIDFDDICEMRGDREILPRGALPH
jgi:hypothetical protein